MKSFPLLYEAGLMNSIYRGGNGHRRGRPAGTAQQAEGVEPQPPGHASSLFHLSSQTSPVLSSPPTSSSAQRLPVSTLTLSDTFTHSPGAYGMSAFW